MSLLLAPSDDPFELPDISDTPLPFWTQLASWPDEKPPAPLDSPSIPESFAEALGGRKSEAAAAAAAAAAGLKRKYAREACQFCRQRKLKCDE
eukprot:346609-Hanusia_phi.AAC.1